MIFISISTNFMIKYIDWKKLYNIVKLMCSKQIQVEPLFDKYYFSSEIRLRSRKLFINKSIPINLLSWCYSCNNPGIDFMTDTNKIARLEKLTELDVIDENENSSMYGYKHYDYLISLLNGVVDIYDEHEDDEDSNYDSEDDLEDDDDEDEDEDDEDDESVSDVSECSTVIANDEVKEDLDINQTTDYNNDEDVELNPNDYIIENSINCNLYLEAHEIMFNNVPYIGWSIYLSQIIAYPCDCKNHPFRELTDEDDLMDKNRYLRGIVINNYISRNILKEIINTESRIHDIDINRSKLIKALVGLSH